MTEFKFSCPQCRQKIQCNTSYVGSRINCPSCQHSIIVPPVPPSVVPPSERVIQIKVSTLRKVAIIGLCALLAAGIVTFALVKFTKVTVLKGNARLNTPQSFRPPVEITVVAKTDSTNLRLAYAADQIIFNWEMDKSQFRIDGGPADGLHKPGAGRIPVGKYVTVKWVVTTTHQAIYVDDRLRFEHDGDYSHINRPVSVFPANGSTVTVKSIKVKHIADSSR
jgi:DNA-directed RNA polymerase subunit RPC12/RpoP